MKSLYEEQTQDQSIPGMYSSLKRNERFEEIQQWLRDKLSEYLGIEPAKIQLYQPFASYGLSSRDAIVFSSDLSAWLGHELAPTLFWDYPSIGAIARHLSGGSSEVQDANTDMFRTMLEVETPTDNDAIAIVGMACRFPGAANLEAYWQLLSNGVDAVTETPPQRWDTQTFYTEHADGPTPGKMTTRWGGFIAGIDLFDAPLFGISPRVAQYVDPQQRLLLEVAWEALEHAGIAPHRLAGSKTGVFIGISTNDYAWQQVGDYQQINAHFSTGGAFSIAANRLSYTLDLRGPSLAVDTACSSSLVAVHLACQSLRNGECRLALVGGVNAILTPEITIAFSQAQMMAADGRCKTFDASADGYVRGEGCGVVVLKRHSEALRDGDTILALVRGSAVNQDGRSNGLTAPNGEAQQEVIRAALQVAKVAPADISYIEAHGTGTPLGDPIELHALSTILSHGRRAEQKCLVGSVKTNIGHLEAAAGMASLLKVVLALQKQAIPPHLHLKQLNPHIDLAHTPLSIPSKLCDWPEVNGPHYAGISAFGFGGTNAHVILQEALVSLDEKQAEGDKRPLHLFCLSARSMQALRTLAERHIDWLNSHATNHIADICFTAHRGRTHMAHRLAVITHSTHELSAQLESFVAGNAQSGIQHGQTQHQRRPKIAFLFTGQGAQYPGMGKVLYETQPVFRQTLEQCDTILRSSLQYPLLSILYGDDEKTALLDRTDYTQPALFALEYALAQLWISWGIVPDAVLGHSVGEYVAACLADVMSLEDALKLVAERGRLMQGAPDRGTMVAVFADASYVTSILPADGSKDVSIAAFNGPRHTVIAGAEAGIQRILQRLRNDGIDFRLLNVSHAFHSPLMEPILNRFTAVAQKIQYAHPKMALVSNLTGKIMDEDMLPGAMYWRQHLRAPVRFAEGMHALKERGYQLFIEVGPKPSLLNLARQCLPEEQLIWLASLKKGKNDWQCLLDSLSTLYVQGIDIHWEGFEQHYRRHKLSLPTYPFEHKSYWLKTGERDEAARDVLWTNDPPTHNGQNSHSRRETPHSMQSSKPMNGQLSTRTSTEITQQQPLVLAKLTTMISGLLGMPPDELDIHTPFLEIGADSLVLLEAIRLIEHTFGVKIAVRQLFEEFTTLADLAAYLATITTDTGTEAVNSEVLRAAPSSAYQQPEVSFSPITLSMQQGSGEPPASPAFALASTQEQQNIHADSLVPSVERVIAQQLKVMEHQLDVLRTSTTPQLVRNVEQVSAQNAPNNAVKANDSSVLLHNIPPQENMQRHEVSSPTQTLPVSTKTQKTGLTERQQQYLDQFVAQYTQRTQGSKQFIQRYRGVLADSRASAGFRFSIKELLYPIIADRSDGAAVYDIDSNKYIDISMGFGVHLFGHNPPFIMRSIERQMSQGMQLGPHTTLSGKVAELLTEMTGMERVAFCNTGTEAVMLALRLARTVTNRSKIALFRGSYHGSFDGVLANREGTIEHGHTVPIVAGVPESMTQDVLVLDYGDPHSLEVLRHHAHTLAAVLVEPVQSRRPDLQPREFLHQLRQLTRNADIALIFDEVIMGFRIHQGGAQAWFGVEADLATYGKVIGGGMPIGAVAGQARYMDPVDGGMWQYGDASYPMAKTTFYAGTFNKNPLTMAAALASLEYLKEQGPALQAELNARTEQMITTLNTFFQAEEVPIQVVHYGSLFRFAFSSNMDLFFYHLLHQGIYTWEGRNCFLSTAHTDEDIQRIIAAVQESIWRMREGGFLPDRAPHPPHTPPDTHGGYRPSTVAEVLINAENRSTRNTNTKESDEGTVASQVEQKHISRQIPLTEAQQHLWAVTQMHEDGLSAYNESLVLAMRGPLSVEAFRHAVEQVVARHEALRTAISTTGDGQIIFPHLTLDVPCIDLSHYDPQERDHRAKQWITEECRRPFDLTQVPLMRVNLVKLAEEHHLLVLVVHHIVIDGWSIGVIVQEIGALYTASSQEKMVSLAAPCQLSAYVDQTIAYTQSTGMADDEAFWLQQFTDTPPVLELPTDRVRPPLQSYAGSRMTMHIDADLSMGLRTFSRQHKSTLFITLFTAYLALLHRLTGQDDIVVGIPVGGRTLEGSDTLVGYSVNIVPVCSSIHNSDTFAQLLRTTRGKVLDSFEHQQYPFTTLIKKLNLVRDASRPLLVSTLFNMDRPMPVPQAGELTIDIMDSPISYVKFDLSMSIIELRDELIINIDYNTDLFDATTISRIQELWRRLLSQLIIDAAQPLARLFAPDQSELHRLLVEWNDTQAAYPQQQRISEFIEEQAARTPEAIAVRANGKALTYQELNQQANQLAHYMQICGVKAEVPVGLLLERSVEMLVGILAVLKAGGAYVPLDPLYPHERLTFILQQTHLPLLVTLSHLQKGLPLHQDIQIICLDLESKAIAEQPNTNLTCIGSIHELAYIIYTSGSTGQPKGVAITHRNLVHSTFARMHYYQGTVKAYLLLSSFAFDSSVAGIFWTLCQGGTLILPPEDFQQDLSQLLTLIEHHQISHLLCIPSLYTLMVSYARPLQLESLRTVIIAGEASSQELVNLHYRMVPQATLFNEYGPTEGTVWCSVYRCLVDMPRAKPPIGRPIANTKLYLLDQEMQPVPIGMQGEVYIGGIGIARGYMRRPDLTAERFLPDCFSNEAGMRLYRTGDLARYLPDGNIEFLGRVDHQVKIRGYRIELDEIEAALYQHPAVQECIVLDQEEESGQHCLVAYVTQAPQYLDSNSGEHITENEQRREHITEYQDMYDQFYSHDQDFAADDPFINTRIWTSSYTNQPLPKDEVLESVNDTVQRILELRPADVLEIGCGTGLLLTRIAPHCRSYCGTDISNVVVSQLQARLHTLELRDTKISLAHKAAHDLSGLPQRAFDTVIINEVTQHFSDVNYLIQVIKNLVAVLKPGGTIFIGGVRSHALLKTFHTSLQLYQAPPSASVIHLQQRIREHLLLEKDLVIDPALFAALQTHIPAISRVQVRLKGGVHHNEITRFKYDVMLQVNGVPAPSNECVWLDWQEQQLSLSLLRQRLSETTSPFLGIRRIANARLLEDVTAIEVLEEQGNQLRSIEDVWQEIHRRVQGGIDPELLCQLGRELGYSVDLCWSASCDDGRYDALFAREAETGPAFSIETCTHLKPWSVYANNPLQSKATRDLVPQLRSYLSAKLPQYMVPSFVVPLDAIPRTPNGKVNHRALPKPIRISAEKKNFVLPRTPVEKELARIWSEVLRVEQIGILDNFFELGGDSILSVRVGILASRAGLQFTPKQMFQYQTIAQLSAVVNTQTGVDAEQGLVLGSVPLTPIQHWFFAQQFPQPHHWNQSFLLTVRVPLSAEQIHQVVEYLLRQHDALRLRFACHDGRWHQEQVAPTQDLPVSLHDLTNFPATMQPGLLEQTAQRLQSSLNIETGPLLHLAYFHLDETQGDRLLLIIHHLAVDGVSWRILLEDIKQCWQHLSQGQALAGTSKTTSFQQWSGRLQQYAHSEALLQELPHWSQVVQAPVATLPSERSVASNERLSRQSARTVEVTLDATQTQLLVQQVPAAYHTQMQEVLLTALGLTLSGWIGEKVVLVDLEGHGREDLFAEVDLSRTVGWFTSLYPVRLELADMQRDVERALKRVKEQMRAVPQHGIGYGLLRYKAAQKEVSKVLDRGEQAQVCFNYLGQYQEMAEGIIGLASEMKGQEIADSAQMLYKLEINSYVVGGKLRMEWTFSEREYERKTVEGLAHRYMEHLQELIEVCTSEHAGGYTPSDFPEANLSQEELDELLAEFGESIASA